MSELRSCTDGKLLDLLKGDSEPAFTEIYNRYWKKLLLVAWNHSRNDAIAEDIVHEVFMSLWERRSTIEIDNLSAFLATSIKFSVFRFLQRERRRIELAVENYEFTELIFEEDHLDARFLKEYIDGVVEVMPEKCKLVFRYSRELGMKNKEIAEKMAISEKGVEANMTRALKTIRIELKDYGISLFFGLHILFSILK